MGLTDTLPFQRGVSYRRRDDVHGKFGGQHQGGISTPRHQPFIFLFTGDEGEAYGYKDGWDPSGVFLYTGEGQEGDMEFSGGNRAIRDHAVDGKDLLLFQTLGKGKPVRFLGDFSCANYEYRTGADRNGKQRQTIVFHLLPADGIETDVVEVPNPVGMADTQGIPLEVLRRRAYEAAGVSGGGGGREALRTYRQRSQAVRAYVLRRAGGLCECCGSKAPFLRADGTAYLEPHHIRRLTDGGPDHPKHVGAICPNCHREIHHGRDGVARNNLLRDRVWALEPGNM
jgi:5-methylcytosine-specific restriction protein A